MLAAHVQTLAGMAPRDLDHPENLEKTADYISKQFEMTGVRSGELTYMIGKRIVRIITACFGPDSKERIIVGAHYDAVPGSPGADDNASGIAGLLGLAAAFGGKPPPLRVELVAYPCEEPPFFRTEHMGSYVHAIRLREEKIPVRLMVALESIGYFRDEPLSQMFPNPFFRLLYPSRGNFIAVVGRLREGPSARRFKKAMRSATNLPVHSLNGPAIIPGVDFSDHRNFWRAGYRALMVTDTAFYRNRNYHAQGDLPDTLDYSRMAKVVEGVYAALLTVPR
jgi:Zn-dependent M28 family amino/carboxypeptidase